MAAADGLALELVEVVTFADILSRRLANRGPNIRPAAFFVTTAAFTLALELGEAVTFADFFASLWLLWLWWSVIHRRCVDSIWNGRWKIVLWSCEELC
jgi:hypothetical protein